MSFFGQINGARCASYSFNLLYEESVSDCALVELAYEFDEKST